MTKNANHFGNHAAPELKVNRAGVALQPSVRVGFTRCFTATICADYVIAWMKPPTKLPDSPAILIAKL